MNTEEGTRPDSRPTDANTTTRIDGRGDVQDLKPGDIVDVTIRGARVEELEDGVLGIELTPSGTLTTPVDLPLTHIVTVERMVPAEWPPIAGDLWRDKHGELWFIHQNPSVMRPEPELLGRTTGGARWTDDIDALMEDNAPLSLVRREGGES